MPRYELVEGSSSKFWQIALEGTSFKTTHGKIGSSGTTLLKEWPSEAIAKKPFWLPDGSQPQMINITG